MNFVDALFQAFDACVSEKTQVREYALKWPTVDAKEIIVCGDVAVKIVVAESARFKCGQRFRIAIRCDSQDGFPIESKLKFLLERCIEVDALFQSRRLDVSKFRLSFDVGIPEKQNEPILSEANGKTTILMNLIKWGAQ